MPVDEATNEPHPIIPGGTVLQGYSQQRKKYYHDARGEAWAGASGHSFLRGGLALHGALHEGCCALDGRGWKLLGIASPRTFVRGPGAWPVQRHVPRSIPRLCS